MNQSWNDFIISLYRKLYNKMFFAAIHLVKNGETAKDLVQDTFALAMCRQDVLADHPNPEAWLMKSLRLLSKNELRRRQNSNLRLEDIYDIPFHITDAGISELVPSQLSEEEKQILVWRFEEQIDYREMAKRLGISETGCRSRVSRIVAKCRAVLDKET